MATATADAPTARQLADDFFRDGKWADPLEQLIFADYLDDRCGRPLDAALRRVLVEPWEDRHRLDYAEALEREAGRVACGRCTRGGYFQDRGHGPAWQRCDCCRGTGLVSDGRAERAEFIRVQVEIAGHPIQQAERARRAGIWRISESERLESLRRRERELFRQTPETHAWFGPALRLTTAGTDWAEHLNWFRRGFVASLTCTTADFLAHAGAVFGAAPIEAVTFTDAPIYQSGGNDTYYVGGLGQFLQKYWNRLDRLPNRAAARTALAAVALEFGRAAARLPPLPVPGA